MLIVRFSESLPPNDTRVLEFTAAVRTAVRRRPREADHAFVAYLRDLGPQAESRISVYTDKKQKVHAVSFAGADEDKLSTAAQKAFERLPDHVAGIITKWEVGLKPRAAAHLYKPPGVEALHTGRPVDDQLGRGSGAPRARRTGPAATEPAGASRQRQRPGTR